MHIKEKAYRVAGRWHMVRNVSVHGEQARVTYYNDKDPDGMSVVTMPTKKYLELPILTFSIKTVVGFGTG